MTTLLHFQLLFDNAAYPLDYFYFVLSEYNGCPKAGKKTSEQKKKKCAALLPTQFCVLQNISFKTRNMGPISHLLAFHSVSYTLTAAREMLGLVPREDFEV